MSGVDGGGRRPRRAPLQTRSSGSTRRCALFVSARPCGSVLLQCGVEVGVVMFAAERARRGLRVLWCRPLESGRLHVAAWSLLDAAFSGAAAVARAGASRGAIIWAAARSGTRPGAPSLGVPGEPLGAPRVGPFACVERLVLRCVHIDGGARFLPSRRTLSNGARPAPGGTSRAEPFHSEIHSGGWSLETSVFPLRPWLPRLSGESCSSANPAPPFLSSAVRRAAALRVRVALRGT
ncbi:unnamed protein product [Lampetra planeri]